MTLDNFDRILEAQQVQALLESHPAERRRLRRLVYRCPNNKRCALMEIYVSQMGTFAYVIGTRQSLDHLNEKLELGGIDPVDFARLSDQEKQDYFSGNSCRRVKDAGEPVSQYDTFRLSCPHLDYVDITHDQIRQHLNEGRKTMVVQLTV